MRRTHARGGRSRRRHDPLAGTARVDGVRALPRPAEPWRADRHCERPRLHSRGEDDKLRAFDLRTGRELWQASLPAGGQATSMTYVAGGRQFVVIAAGGACADGHQIRRRGRRVRAPGSRRRKLTRLDGPGLAQHACFRDTRDHEEE